MQFNVMLRTNFNVIHQDQVERHASGSSLTSCIRIRMFHKVSFKRIFSKPTTTKWMSYTLKTALAQLDMGQTVQEPMLVSSVVLLVVAVPVAEVAEEGCLLFHTACTSLVRDVSHGIVREKCFTPDSTDGILTCGQQHVGDAASVA